MLRKSGDCFYTTRNQPALFSFSLFVPGSHEYALMPPKKTTLELQIPCSALAKGAHRNKSWTHGRPLASSRSLPLTRASLSSSFRPQVVAGVVVVIKND